MEELGRLFTTRRPEAVVVATPHNVHISNAMGVVVAGRVAGRLAGAPPSVALDVPAAGELPRLGPEAVGIAGGWGGGGGFGAHNPGGGGGPYDGGGAGA